MENKNKNTKSKIAVIVIGVITALYSVGYLIMCIKMFKDTVEIATLIFGLIPLAMLVATIAVCKMRMKEIDKGEIDEARKY